MENIFNPIFFFFFLTLKPNKNIFNLENIINMKIKIKNKTKRAVSAQIKMPRY